jgi:hypothetical protein
VTVAEPERLPSDWPADLVGVTETVVTTQGPGGAWNVAALGIHAPGPEGTHPTARTWGQTRTWQNFDERGQGYVQFTTDPTLFVEAALGILEREQPVLPEAAAWVRVEPRAEVSGTEDGTRWTDWRLLAQESEVLSRAIPTFNRGYAAVVEATVAASRLDVPGYDSDRLRDRIEYFEGVCDRCGGPAERAAFERVFDLIEQ